MPATTARARRRTVIALTLAVGIGASALGAPAVASTDTTVAPAAAPLTGLTGGQFGIDQAYAVQRTPAFPACTSDTALSSYAVTVLPGLRSDGYPYSEATDGPVDLGNDYLTLAPVDSPTVPWGLARFTPAGEEVRYNGTAWVTEPAGGWTTEQPFAAAGQVYGLGENGFLHSSFPDDYGTFISLDGPLNPGQLVSVQPLTGVNLCVGDQTVGDPAAFDDYLVPSIPLARTDLLSLTSSTGTLSPGFTGRTTTYTLVVPSGAADPTLTVSRVEPGAALTATIGGVPAEFDGSTLGPIALTGASTTVTITVTASTGETRTYTIVVSRPAELADTGPASSAVIAGGMIALGLLAVGVILRSRTRYHFS